MYMDCYEYLGIGLVPFVYDVGVGLISSIYDLSCHGRGGGDGQEKHDGVNRIKNFYL